MRRARKILTLTLHKHPDRRALYRESMPFRFDETLACLCVFDPAIIAAIFRSDRFDVIAFAEQYRYIQQQTGLDFDATIAAFDHVPLANEGPAHKRSRSEIAAVVADKSGEPTRIIETYVGGLVSGLFSAGREVDLAADLARPIFLELFSLWLGVDHRNLVDDPNFSQVFDMKLSLNRRRKLNRNVDQLTCAFARQREALPTTPEFATAMNILGNDALRGTVALSLWQVLAKNSGVRLDRVAFPQDLPSTGVPYIERVAREDVEIAGMKVEKGQRVRLVLDATASDVSGVESDLLFGRGRHVCLGKPITLAIWRTIVRTLATIPLNFTIGELKLRTGDYAFSYPEYALVSIHE
jgi:cytochrome P450